MNQTARFLGVDLAIESSDILINSNYIDQGYGVVGEREITALNYFSKFEALLLDPVYTGRAAGGMIDLIQSGIFSQSDKLLFWHTGGTPALFADRYKDIIKE